MTDAVPNMPASAAPALSSKLRACVGAYDALASSAKRVWSARTASGDRFVLRDGAAIVDLRVSDDGAIEARRVTWSAEGTPRMLDEETVEAPSIGCARVHYHQRSTGLDVTVTCEEETHGEPPARALADPDEGALP